MGTITRSFANNITTSGVFKSTAFNNASFDNVSSLSSATISGGNFKLISTQNPSSVSSVEFTSGIDSTYKEYRFICTNIGVSTSGANFQINFSTNGGTSYGITKTTSAFYFGHNEGDTDWWNIYSSGADVDNNTNPLPYQSLSNASDAGMGLIMYLYNPSSTTFYKNLMVKAAVMTNSDYTSNNWHGGYIETTSAIDAVKFSMSAGTFSGTIQMFGIL